ncbi:hypothetical protein E4665_17835 [Sporolactobacillus shoreae]|uniref:Phage holin n=1 Tax=Sporolactobacillus shoreae TaxID=1465501 RepID=A0A4Z0GIF6_9BACL|nr:phage holin, LLH family [Sporolactobacillus shoreae]TGA95578.1 hypothetical protein E4665_17835 [Sporolactobacillus shoreae]
MNNLYLLIGAAILLVAILFVLALVSARIWASLTAAQRKHVEQAAARAVLLIEQQAKEYYESPSGQEKRKLALELLASWLSRSFFHIRFTPEQLEGFIQEAFDLSGLKHQVDQVQAKVETVAKEGEPVG